MPVKSTAPAADPAASGKWSATAGSDRAVARYLGMAEGFFLKPDVAPSLPLQNPDNDPKTIPPRAA